MSGLMEVAAESAVQAQAPSGARDLAGSAADLKAAVFSVADIKLEKVCAVVHTCAQLCTTSFS